MKNKSFHPLLLRFVQALGISLVTLSAASCAATKESKACRNDLAEDAACPSADDTEAYWESTGELDDICGDFAGVVDGPTFDPVFKKCCYTVERTQKTCAIEGRPLTIDGRAVTSRAEAMPGWADACAPDRSRLNADDRDLLAEAWTSAALFEHASIASFARFSLELLALGAPPALVEEAHAAALDEARHARVSFGLAAAYRGADVGPSPLPIGGGLSITSDLVALAVSVARDACIGETVAAAVAREQLDRASDPEVQRALAMIAEDEARHAELAWKAVAWALRFGGEPVREAVAGVFEEVAAAAGDPVSRATLANSALAAHGYLTPEEERALTAMALRAVVLPCARALLTTSQSPSEAARAPAPVPIPWLAAREALPEGADPLRVEAEARGR